MKKTLIQLTLAAFFSLFFIRSFSQPPHLTGTVSISIKTGKMHCDFLLSNIPDIKDYTIWLNAGFNLQYLRDSADKENYFYYRSYDDQVTGECFQYIIPDSDTTKFLPHTIRFSYTGAFPVMNDSTKRYDRLDWKGNMAFNGASARLTEQSAWYPILYDKKNDIVINKYTYNIKVDCVDGDAVYLNGDIPKTGKQNSFASAVPVPLLLFAGNYSFIKTNEQYFINTGLLPEERDVLSNWTNNITDFYAAKLAVPYGRKISFIACRSVATNKSWMFVTYPTLLCVSNNQFSIHNILNKTSPVTVDTSNIQYIAHELGHYYFGTLTSPNSDLRWFFLEGITEFISLKYVQQNLGDTFYKAALAGYLNNIKGFTPIPLSQIKTAGDIGYTYQYNYIPLLLVALEKEVGENKIWNWLSYIVKDKNAVTDYAYLKSSLAAAGVSDEAFRAFETMYINNPHGPENLVQLERR